ncbi:hypothetical protein Bca101_068434 [Brassica carinata]
MKFSQLKGMEKEMAQNLEWLEAQKIEISIDLNATAKQHLQFLGVVDRKRWLYDGYALERAIYRSDCEEFYGRVLDNSGIESSANGSCKLQTENLWKRLYPMEPYDLDLDKAISEPNDISPLEKCATYDLVSAAKRQSSFYLEVSRAHVDSEIVIEEAVGRYKAFLYLIQKNREKKIKLISVPTYDIDLIWHTHQLNPSSYYKDMVKIFCNILQHDDTADSETSEGMRLNTVFSGTTAQWEETFGRSYWKFSMDTMPHSSVVVETEKSGAGARCLAEAAEKCGAGARCFAVEAEKNSARCFAVEAEKKNARCLAITNGKSIARCLAVDAEKNSARCLAVDAEKNSARRFAVEAEKNSARCLAVEAENKSSRCFAVEAEEKNARCLAMINGKSSARCFAMATGKNSARCLAVAAEKNVGCGNLMEKNAKENATLTEGTTAA